MIKPLLVKIPTSCGCGGNEAWYIELPETGRYCMGCACHNERPTLGQIEAYLLKHGLERHLEQYELYFRSNTKDVIEQQSLVDDHLMDRLEENVAHGFEFKNGEVKLLIDEVKRLRLELADFEMMCDHTSQIYDWASGGRISKPTTLPSEVMAQGDDRINELVEEAVEERTRAARKLLPALMDLLSGSFSALPHSTARILEDLVIDALDQLPHPERRWPGQAQPGIANECNAMHDPRRTEHRGI